MKCAHTQTTFAWRSAEGFLRLTALWLVLPPFTMKENHFIIPVALIK